MLVSFLGAVVRPMGDWMPIGGAVELLEQLGLDAAGTRTAVSRLKRRGWLAAGTRHGLRGYTLTPQARRVLAAGDEVVWHARQPADLADGWCVVGFSIPESDRAQRHRLRTSLTDLGFGNVGAATWIAPARMREAVRDAVVSLGLQDHVVIFVGDYLGTRDLPALLHGGWDLAAIDRSYRDFVAEYEPVAVTADAAAGLAPRAAFASYLAVVDHWRKLPYRDPGLPPELLAADWSAPRAGAVFERLVRRLEGPALAHAAGFWPDPVSRRPGAG